jgi:hypothetical protein
MPEPLTVSLYEDLGPQHDRLALRMEDGGRNPHPAAASDPRFGSVEYWNSASAEPPSELKLPLSVAAVVVMSDAATVSAAGRPPLRRHRASNHSTVNRRRRMASSHR